MTNDSENQPPPKRVAMQVALAAEQGVAMLDGRLRELEDSLTGGTLPNEQADVILHLLERRTGDTLADLRKQIAELRETIGEMQDWRAGFLAADGPAGVVAIDDRVHKIEQWQRDVHNTVQKIVDLVPGNLWAGKGGALATQQQIIEAIDTTLVVDGRLREVEQWQQAELEGAQDTSGVVGGLVEMVAELNEEVQQLRGRLAHMPIASGAVEPTRGPHVLSLVLELQKRVAEIGKGREFRAENARGVVTQQYSFRGVDDAQNAIGTAQREIGLIGPAVTILDKTVRVDTVPKGNYTEVWTTVSVTARYTFQSPVDGSTWSTEGCGMGRDKGDKAENKAETAAYKVAMFHGLNIPVNGAFVDIEAEDPQIQQEMATAGQREQRGYAQDRDAGRTYGHGHPPAGWREDDGRDRPRDADQLDTLPVDPPGDVESAAAGVRRANPPADNRSPEQLAADALRAVRSAADADQAARVWLYAQQRGVLSMHVEGAQLGTHMMAAIRMLPNGAAMRLTGMEHYL